jgi:hypothetical protein
MDKRLFVQALPKNGDGTGVSVLYTRALMPPAGVKYAS